MCEKYDVETSLVLFVDYSVGYFIIIFILKIGCARVVTVIVDGNGHGNSRSNLEEAVYISHGKNILGKGMHPSILLLTTSKR